MPDPRMHDATKAVLRAFLEDPKAQRYGLEICKIAGLTPGTVQPILIRLERTHHWLRGEWEEGYDSLEARRGRRRYYWLTAEGEQSARNALVRAEQKAAKRQRGRSLSSRLAGNES